MAQQKLPAAAGVGKIEERSIVNEMQDSYLDYAMSVIISRALPDVRDGLKPVHRRVLYAMWSLGLKPSAKFKKSAFVVGEVMAKYHPHGDVAIYDTLVRLAQDFSMRFPLVWGQGNFGSLDGDGAAAMRYTECKLAHITEELLVDIEKDTVTFAPNYDGSYQEPRVLPAKLPNLLLNGTVGIAVGMATNIPPHNLGELCDAVMYLIENPECSGDDLFALVPGPDFPTGGIVYGKEALRQAYATGRGSVVVRGKAEIEEGKNGSRIVVHEIPYGVNKADLISHIADLVRDKKLEGIRDLRDESSRGVVRIIVELKRDAYPKKVLNQLYSATTLQSAFHYNLLALVDGIQPRVLNLKSILEEYLKHRTEVVRRRTQYDLNKAKDRAHILEGLRIAILHIDEVIAIIKKSQDRAEAKVNLIKKFKLTEPQTEAILDMRLHQLANLERLKVEAELKDKMEIIKELESILASPKKLRGVIKTEVGEVKSKYSNPRRTQVIAHGVKDFSAEDLIPDEQTIVIVTRDNYIKRVASDTFRTQARGGKGVMGLETKEEDVVEHFFSASTHADLLFFTNRGRVFKLKAYEVPVASRTAKGQALVNFLQLAPQEKVTAILSLKDLGDYKYLVMVTRKGLIKKTNIGDFEVVRRSGLIAINLKDEDALEWVKPSAGKDDVILVTAKGQSIRFKESDVRPMGRSAAGVHGLRLKGQDRIVGIDIIDPEMVKKNLLELFVIMDNGFGKRTNLNHYKVQKRGGSGIKTAKITSKTGEIVGAYVSNAKDERDLIIISSQGQVIRLPFRTVSVSGRDTQGVHLMRFKEKGDTVASLTFV
ncbi:MAG: DNA gyrase subunit A [Patescibacteria group bacterium]